MVTFKPIPSIWKGNRISQKCGKTCRALAVPVVHDPTSISHEDVSDTISQAIRRHPIFPIFPHPSPLSPFLVVEPSHSRKYHQGHYIAARFRSSGRAQAGRSPVWRVPSFCGFHVWFFPVGNVRSETSVMEDGHTFICRLVDYAIYITSSRSRSVPGSGYPEMAAFVSSHPSNTYRPLSRTHDTMAVRYPVFSARNWSITPTPVFNVSFLTQRANDGKRTVPSPRPLPQLCTPLH